MRKLLLACSLFALTLVARAASIDDVLEMSKKGEPEDKIIAAIDATPGELNVGAQDVLRLRDAKVSDKVIMAMLRHAGTEKVAKPEQPLPPAPAPVQPGQPRREAPPPAVVREGPIPANGRLTIDNLDDRPWAYMYEAAIQTIWIAPPGNGSSIREHGSLTLSMRAGTYKVRFLGTQDEGLPLTIYGGEKSAINLTHVNVDGSESLYATVFERGERKANAKLAALDKLPPQEQVVVQREIVEAPTYYYDPPVYYSSPGYYYGGGYPYYGLGLSFTFGNGGHYHGGGSYYHGGGSYYHGGGGYRGGGSGYRSGGSRR